MNEQESIAYIEKWDVTEAAKVLKWYEDDKLLRPCDCDAIVAIETEDLKAENAELRELCVDVHNAALMLCRAWEGSCSKEAEGMSLHTVCPIGDTSELCVFGKLHDRMRELGIEADG